MIQRKMSPRSLLFCMGFLLVASAARAADWVPFLQRAGAQAIIDKRFEWKSTRDLSFDRHADETVFYTRLEVTPIFRQAGASQPANIIGYARPGGFVVLEESSIPRPDGTENTTTPVVDGKWYKIRKDHTQIGYPSEDSGWIHSASGEAVGNSGEMNSIVGLGLLSCAMILLFYGPELLILLKQRRASESPR